MSAAITIARFFRIPIKVHWTFALVFLYLGFRWYRESWSPEAFVWVLAFVFFLFLCVVLHEYGHALTARYFGIATHDIILSPIGGVARLENLPDKPWQEFVVAIAGPAVNLVLALPLAAFFLSFPATVRQQIIQVYLNPASNFFLPLLQPWEYFLILLFFMNLILAAFNLLPAFPMDGGRMLRALLSFPLGRFRATQLAARLGQLLALVLLGYGIYYGHFTYQLAGIFVFFTAASEYRGVYLEHLMEKVPVADLMRQQFSRVYVDDAMSLVWQLQQEGPEKQFLVFDRWQTLVGILPDYRIHEAQRQGDGAALVQDYTIPVVHPLLQHENLRQAYRVFQQVPVGILPVYNAFHRLVGLLDVRTIGDYLRAQGGGRWGRFFRW